MKKPGVLPIDNSISFDSYCQIDLSITNTDLTLFDSSASAAWEKYIESYLEKNNALVAYGGYLEIRNLYDRSAYFQSFADDEKRNIHLGIDFWCTEGTKVCAFFEGRVHSFANNQNYGDYGPTIILEHNFEDIHFYSLYGHLSEKSIKSVEIGKPFKTGENFAELGDASINGDYAPHLHFQIIYDLEGYVGDYPGVTSKKNLEFYRQNCPDPFNLIQKNA